MTAITVSPAADADWDAAIGRGPGGTIFQTTLWARYQRAYLGAVPFYLVMRNDGEIVGRLLVLEMPRTGEAVLGGRGTRLSGMLRPLVGALSWREGPVVHSDQDRTAAVEAFFAAVRDLARERGVTGIEESSLPLRVGVDDTLERAVAGLGYRVGHRATVRIDLGRPIESIWAGLKPDVARTPIRKAGRQGLEVRPAGSEADLERFYGLVERWRRDQGLSRWARAKYSLMREHLGDHATMFLALHGGRPAGGAGIWHFAGGAYLFSPVQSALARQERIYAGDFLFWKIIEWCHARRMHTFDLSGVSLRPEGGKDEGIRRFKEKWGGTRVEYPVFALAVKRWRWAGVDTVRGWRA